MGNCNIWDMGHIPSSIPTILLYNSMEFSTFKKNINKNSQETPALKKASAQFSYFPVFCFLVSCLRLVLSGTSVSSQIVLFSPKCIFLYFYCLSPYGMQYNRAREDDKIRLDVIMTRWEGAGTWSGMQVHLSSLCHYVRST